LANGAATKRLLSDTPLVLAPVESVPVMPIRLFDKAEVPVALAMVSVM
jgi:hypothetical protein